MSDERHEEHSYRSAQVDQSDGDRAETDECSTRQVHGIDEKSGASGARYHPHEQDQHPG